jgi:hypothetical protein
MASMPGRVTRTITFAAMDPKWSADPESFLKAYDTTSEQMKKLLADAASSGVIRSEVAKHVEQHWLYKYWPKADARAVLQRGLYWAMKVALYRDGDPQTPRTSSDGKPAPLPVSCIWVCSSDYSHDPNARQRFEVSVVESAYQVTLLFLTPDPEGDEVPEPGCFQPVWSTRHEEFKPVPGELQIGPTWEQVITVRPYDYKPV